MTDQNNWAQKTVPVILNTKVHGSPHGGVWNEDYKRMEQRQTRIAGNASSSHGHWIMNVVLDTKLESAEPLAEESPGFGNDTPPLTATCGLEVYGPLLNDPSELDSATVRVPFRHFFPLFLTDGEPWLPSKE